MKYNFITYESIIFSYIVIQYVVIFHHSKTQLLAIQYKTSDLEGVERYPRYGDWVRSPRVSQPRLRIESSWTQISTYSKMLSLDQFAPYNINPILIRIIQYLILY